MKILLLDLGKNLRGGQRQVLYLARHLLQNENFKPVIAAPKGTPLLAVARSEGIPSYPLLSPSDLNPINIITFFRLLKREKPAIVHTNDAKGASLGALAKLIGKISFKLVHTRRVSYELKKGWSLKKYDIGDAVVGVSREIQEKVIASGIRKFRTDTIHSGVDLNRYSLDKISNETRTIGAVGALTHQKGTSVLLDSLDVLNKDSGLPTWKCLIAGDGPLMEDLRKKAQSLGLGEKVLFLGYQDSHDFLKQINILAVPSVDGEGSNAVIKEGWATGTPVVASDLPSNLELVTNGENGLTFPNRDSDTLAHALRSLLLSESTVDKIRTGGLESVQRFTARTMAEHYMSLYKKLIQ